MLHRSVFVSPTVHRIASHVTQDVEIHLPGRLKEKEEDKIGAHEYRSGRDMLGGHDGDRGASLHYGHDVVAGIFPLYKNFPIALLIGNSMGIIGRFFSYYEHTRNSKRCAMIRPPRAYHSGYGTMVAGDVSWRNGPS